MKKIKFILALLFISNSLLAQYSSYKPTGEKYKRMVDTKLKAVYTGNSRFDSLYSKYVKEVFSEKNIDFISNNEFEAERTNINYSFIVPIEMVTYNTDDYLKSNAIDRYFMLAYYPGTKKKILAKDLNPGNFISYVTFDASLPEGYLDSSLYRLKNIIQELHQTVEILEKSGENKIFLHPSKYLNEVYNSKSKRIKDKELIVCSDKISITEKEFKKVYPYKFKILDRESYKNEIAKNKEGQCYLLIKGYTVEVLVIDSYSGEVILGTSFVPKIGMVTNPTKLQQSLKQLNEKQLSEIVKMIK